MPRPGSLALHHGGVGKEWVAVISALLAGAFALATFLMTRRAALRDRAAEAERVALRYRIPLLQSAFDLQTRLYNVRRQAFLERFYANSTNEAERSYAINNTLFLFAQYLCFGEIIRYGLLFATPSDRQRQQGLVEAMERIRDILSTSIEIPDRTLCLFRGEQRAIGEVMLVPVEEPSAGGPRWDCLGYAAFSARLTHEPEFAAWFDSLKSSLEVLATDLDQHDTRLIGLQHRLLDLVTLIDPSAQQVTGGLRERL
jgi:hypothetical protein